MAIDNIQTLNGDRSIKEVEGKSIYSINLTQKTLDKVKRLMNERSQLKNKEQAMKMLIIFSAVIFVALIGLIVWNSMGDVDAERRKDITVDMSQLKAAMVLWNQEAKLNVKMG